MKRITSALATSLLIFAACCFDVQAQKPAAPLECNDNSETLEYWRTVREAAADAPANSLLLVLADCLQSANPELRDRIAYEVITYWLRNKRVSDQNVSRLRLKLIPWLREGAGTASGDSAIARAFSALVLS